MHRLLKQLARGFSEGLCIIVILSESASCNTFALLFINFQPLDEAWLLNGISFRTSPTLFHFRGPVLTILEQTPRVLLRSTLRSLDTAAPIVGSSDPPSPFRSHQRTHRHRPHPPSAWGRATIG